MRHPKLLLSFLASALITQGAIAGSHDHAHKHEHKHEQEHKHKQEHEHHAAHVHGVSHLNLVLEGQELLLDLTSPAANIVGFEHKPATEQQRTTLRQAAAELRRGGELFRLPEAAECRFSGAEVRSTLLVALLEDHDHSHDHGHDHDHEAHADIHSEYRFICSSPARLNQIEVTLFSAFPATERIEVQSITPSGQQHHRLTPQQRTIRLR